MKTKIEVKEVEREDLVNLFSGLSSDDYFRVNLDDFFFKARQKNVTFPKDCKCIEDKVAYYLELGGKILITDYCSEEDDEPYTDKGMKVNGIINYAVDLEDIRNGIQDALNGEFKHNDDENNVDWARESAYNLAYAPENFDADNVTALIQVILFNEIIYA